MDDMINVCETVKTREQKHINRCSSRYSNRNVDCQLIRGGRATLGSKPNTFTEYM